MAKRPALQTGPSGSTASTAPAAAQTPRGPGETAAPDRSAPAVVKRPWALALCSGLMLAWLGFLAWLAFVPW